MWLYGSSVNDCGCLAASSAREMVLVIPTSLGFT